MPIGVFVALAVFLGWGMLPLFWKELVHVSPYEVVCHRVVWSCVFTGVLVSLMGRWREVARWASSLREVLAKGVASGLLCANWLVFIWAVTSDYVLEASLGYYICPLVFTLLSRIVYRDTLRPLQWVAIGLAVCGVGNLVFSYGYFPWIALSLAWLFAVYGLINKKVAIGAVPGLFVETLMASIPAGGYLVYLALSGQASFLRVGNGTDLLLISAGIVTTLPLVGFSFAAKRLRLVTIGMCQYLVPTCFFILGVLVYGEPFTVHHLVTFVLIWVGIALYLVENIVEARRVLRRGESGVVSR